MIKPSFPQPGLKHPSHATTSVEQIGLATATVLARAVPISVAGIVFLSGTLTLLHFYVDLLTRISGGLSDSDAVKYLNAVNAIVNSPTADSPLCFSRLPPLTFSFGRGLQGDAMQKWAKGDENGAKQAFEERAKTCWKAARGELV